MKLDFIRAELEGLEQRNRERSVKRRKVQAESIERQKMGTARQHRRFVRSYYLLKNGSA